MDRFVLSLIVVIGGITGIVLYQIFLSEAQLSKTSCLPKDFSQVNFEFPVKVPLVLPEGYSLQGIETVIHPQSIVILFYADHSMCLHWDSEFNRNLLHVVVRKENNMEGHAILSSNGTIVGYNETHLPPMTSLEFQQAMIKSILHYGNNRTAIWKAVDINSYKGLTVSSQSNNGVEFLNEKDQMVYGVGGNLSLNQLVMMAKSIPS